MREVHEETGHRVTLDRPLPDVHYKVGGRRKVVHFWAARADDPAPRWEATAEVDRVKFRPASKALKRLSYEDERDVVRAFLDDQRPTIPLVVLRHTSSLGRSKWAGDDASRPLTRSGKAAAKRLIAPLEALGVDRVISSDANRCADTVRRYADQRHLDLDLTPDLSEAGYEAASDRAGSVVRKLIAERRPAVVCSHRPVLPALLGAATASGQCAVPDDPLPAGGFHVLHIADGTVIAIDTFPR
jgi:8-oxo-dGTP diphosphatase